MSVRLAQVQTESVSGSAANVRLAQIMSEAVTDLPSTSHLNLAQVAIEVVTPACQRVQIVGGGFMDASGRPIADGVITFYLSADARACSGQQVPSGRSVSATLDESGDIPISPVFFLWPNASLTNKLGDTSYSVQVKDSRGQLVFEKSKVTVPVSADQWDITGAL